MRIIGVFFFLVMACRPSNQISELVGVLNERPLEDTVWILIELNGNAIPPSGDQKEIFVIYQGKEKMARGFAGCNSFTGSYVKDGSSISAFLAATRMYCERKMDVETGIMNVLSEKTKYEIKGNHLLLKANGNVVAKFLAEIKTEG